MFFENLEQKLQANHGDAVKMLRTNPASHHPFSYPPEYSYWWDEDIAWRETCVLFDQSHHMGELRIVGPDAKRLITETAVNSPSRLASNNAKQYVAVGPDGRFIGDAVLFVFDDENIRAIGPTVGSWIAYQAQAGGYDVEVSMDPPTPYNRTGGRDYWRYQLNGPATQQIVEAAIGRPLEQLRFFGMTQFEIASTPVYAVNHTMSGKPGDQYTGLELWGPWEHRFTVLDALLQAGMPLGLQRGGATAYLSANNESGWVPTPLPAIYSQPEHKGYREFIGGFTLESLAPLEGSFVSSNIEDYYYTPWDLDYGRLIKFDHDFIGRPALEAMVDAPHRKKVWIRWNSDDVARVMKDSYLGEGRQPKFIGVPNPIPASTYYDEVRKGDKTVGVSVAGGYTANMRTFQSVAILDEMEAYDGNEVEFVWGEADGGEGRALTKPLHVQTTIRATVSTSSTSHA